MLANYFKIALVLLRKHKLFALINIVGLAAGLSACLLILLYVLHELSYDDYHEDAERIYRISRDYYPVDSSPEMLLAVNAPQAAPLLQQNFSEIEQVTRIYRGFSVLVRGGEEAYYENLIRYADANVFDFFSFDWLQGEPELALAEPGSIVLTRTLAEKYFGAGDAMGRVLELEFGLPLQVTGVIEDLPGNTHLGASAFASLSSLQSRFGEDFSENWASNNFYTYIMLEPDASIHSLAAQLPAFVDRHIAPQDGIRTGMRVQALTDIHLNGAELQFPMKPAGDMKAVLVLIAVALCILLVACINFTNLSTARFSQRAKEVGMRKAIGASRGDIIRQFLGESTLSTLLAMLLALGMVELMLPLFNAFTDRELVLDYLSDPTVLLALVLLTGVVGLLASVYPAFYLSRYQSAEVLRGGASGGASGVLLRNLLVVLQFSVAIALVAATLVIHAQLHFAHSMDLGFNKDRVLVLDQVGEQWETLKAELNMHPGIMSATASNISPGQNNGNAWLARHEGGSELGQGTQYLLVDYDFFRTYEIEFLAGRSFSPQRAGDRFALPSEEISRTSGGFILSEMAVKQAGWTPESSLGHWVEVATSEGFGQSVRGLVIGVVRDIHFESAQTPVEPVFYMLPPPLLLGRPAFASASLRLSGQNLEETLDFIERKWAEVYPQKPIARRFLDETFQSLYRQQERLGRIFTTFSLLAVVIACMGLFGLAAFIAERRTKEIGVRKVMGGSVWSIVVLLTNDFSKLVLASNLIAWPVAYVAMEGWLSTFAYRIDLTPLIFIGSGLIALCIAWVTVGGTAARAASQKPVLALRYE